MIRFLSSCVVFSCLTGCLSWPQTSRDATTPFATPVSAAASVGQYHFNWKLSGNRAVAPLQIFDDGRRTWLQFPAGQAAPAIFARLLQGDQLLTPTMGQGGLLMLDGVWPQLILRGGSLQSTALRLSDDADAATNMDRSPPAGVITAPTTPPATPIASASSATPLAAAPPPTTSTLPTAIAVTAAATTPHHAPPASLDPVFQVSPADGTLRAVLSHWSSTAGWTFGFEHWAVEVDIPIVAAATFTLPFERAVQELVASTELSDHPLHPCFYANRVLRIVPHTQPCDRSAAGQG